MQQPRLYRQESLNMSTFRAHAFIRSISTITIGVCIAIGAPAPTRANVIADWDENAVSVVRQMTPYAAQRVMGLVHAAMFDAVNSIERRFRPYLAQLPAAPATSKEAAAAAAAAAILVALDSKAANNTKALVATYLASIADGEPKSDGVNLGPPPPAKDFQTRPNTC